MKTRKSIERIVIEELMRLHDDKIVLKVCADVFGYDKRKVSEIMGNIKR
ncbi:hypothetical protein [Sulfuricurvum sp.]